MLLLGTAIRELRASVCPSPDSSNTQLHSVGQGCPISKSRGAVLCLRYLIFIVCILLCMINVYMYILLRQHNSNNFFN
jgi:hypothetical protein